MAPIGRELASYLFAVLVHDVFQPRTTVIAGYVRLILRDCVVGQDWTAQQLRCLQEAVRATEAAERQLAAFQQMVDAKDLWAAARAVADYYYGDERCQASIPTDVASVPVPFAIFPFVLWLFVQRQPGVGLELVTDDPPPIALEVNLSESEIQVAVGPTHTRVAWSDETAKAVSGMGWVGDVDRMVKASNGTFSIFTNADYQMQAVMRWKRVQRGGRENNGSDHRAG